jgi:hypothetical protein
MKTRRLSRDGFANLRGFGEIRYVDVWPLRFPKLLWLLACLPETGIRIPDQPKGTEIRSYFARLREMLLWLGSY